MKEKKLVEEAMKVAKPIREEKGLIRIISHHDCDGICAGSIMYKTLKIMGKNFKIHFIRQNKEEIKEIVDKKADLFIFTDLGSGRLDNLKEFIPDKPVVVVDHHPPQDIKWKNLYHFNCHLVGVDGLDEISGAGMAYLLSRVLTEQAKELINLAIIGATGDMQKSKGKYKGVNKFLLDDAKKLGLIKVKKGIRLFGRYSRPLHKTIEYCIDPYIPGVSGSESGAVQFLHNLGIAIKKGDKWRTMNDLTKNEEKKLATALILEGIVAGNEVNNLIGDVYILPNDYEISEFSTLINACGRLERPMDGVKLCLGEKKSAEDITAAYRRKISQYLRWVEENKDKMKKTDKVTYLIAKNSINENFISPVVSIIIRSTFKTDILFGFANAKDSVKISARLSREAKEKIDVGELVSKAAEKVDGDGGGHLVASGGTIPLGSEEKFIRIVNKMIHENK